MVIVKLRCDKKVNQKLRTYNIDRRKLENLLMFLTNNIVNKRKTYYYEIKVKGISGASSQYFWEEDEIEVALNAADCKSTKQRSIYFVQGLVHEYRHWVQSQLQNVSSKRLNYSEKDIERIWKPPRNWQGAAQGDPFVVRGGYNCRHTWQPVNPEWNLDLQNRQ